MKKLYLIIISVAMSLISVSQTVPLNLHNVSSPYFSSIRDQAVPSMNQPLNPLRAPNAYNETVIGSTYYDLQAVNTAPAHRFYVYDDGTMAAVWTLGSDTQNDYLDRGTGYAYYNGTTWSTSPTVRVESERAGFPSYAPVANGEMIASHHNSMGVIINWRTQRGTGDWNEYIINNPDENVVLSWPRIITSGENRMNVHMLVSTYMPYEGLNPAILYYRSTDGGLTWETEARIIEGMTSEDFYGLRSESYSWAEPKGNSIAFVVADRWSDLIVMRSDDNGETWQKTVVWQHPYPMWNNEAADPFYSPDGAVSLAFDNNGKLHLAFGINRTSFMQGATNYSWYPFVDGIGYWNEDMAGWVDGEPETLHPARLRESGNLIGWVEDLNDNGQIDLLGNNASNLGLYFVGLSSMPQLMIDNNDHIFLVYSGVAETYNNGTQMYRHLFARASTDGGETWTNIIDITSEEAQNMNESVFPTLATSNDNNLHIIYQVDNEPGLSTIGDMDEPTMNSIVYLEVPKSVLVKSNNYVTPDFTIYPNYPNPFRGTTNFNITLDKAATISLRVFDVTGRIVHQVASKNYNAGNLTIPFDASKLSEGMYTYTFIINGSSYSNKLIVK